MSRDFWRARSAKGSFALTLRYSSQTLSIYSLKCPLAMVASPHVHIDKAPGGPSAAELQVLIKDKKYDDIMTQLTSFYIKTTFYFCHKCGIKLYL